MTIKMFRESKLFKLNHACFIVFFFVSLAVSQKLFSIRTRDRKSHYTRVLSRIEFYGIKSNRISGVSNRIDFWESNRQVESNRISVKANAVSVFFSRKFKKTNQIEFWSFESNFQCFEATLFDWEPYTTRKFNIKIFVCGTEIIFRDGEKNRNAQFYYNIRAYENGQGIWIVTIIFSPTNLIWVQNLQETLFSTQCKCKTWLQNLNFSKAKNKCLPEISGVTESSSSIHNA